MDSRDLAWAVMAIRIQREVGGNLAELLDTVAETMTHRERLRREIKSLTAEGRMSAIVLSIFPPAFARDAVRSPARLHEPPVPGDDRDHLPSSAARSCRSIGWFWLSPDRQDRGLT